MAVTPGPPLGGESPAGGKAKAAEAPPAATQALASAAGACTGELITTILFFPIELVKCRLQAAVLGECGSYAYANLLDGLRCVLRDEGFLGLFAGLQTAALRSVTLELTTVFFSETLLAWYRQLGRIAGAYTGVLLRTLGGCVSIVLTMPLETVATRVTTSPRRISMAGAARQLWQERGVASFYRGLLISFVLCLNPAMMLTAVEQLRAVVLALPPRWRGGGTRDGERQQMSWTEAFAVGAVAKLATMVLVYPLIRGKVMLQARNHNAGMWKVLRHAVDQEGARTLYKGLGAQLSKSILSASLKYAVKERTEPRWLHLFAGRPAANGHRQQAR